MDIEDGILERIAVVGLYLNEDLSQRKNVD